MSFDGILWLSYALNGNGSSYDYFNKKTELGDFEVNGDPNGPKGVHEDPTLLYYLQNGDMPTRVMAKEKD
jgi:hypothetical protein